MRNNETGEFELVVGNRQLLSGFFIIVLLFAVAFAMGYVVGQNSRAARLAEQKAPAGTAQAASAGETRPQPDASQPATPPDASPRQSASAAEPPKEAASAAEESAPQPTTQPAREPEPPSTPKKAATPALAEAAPPGVTEIAPGSYWQVIATANLDTAQAIVSTLREKGLPATLGPGPNKLTRVLVGPYSDTASMGRAKTVLESSGFPHLSSLKK